ncbi:MAG TPA: PIN domain-containing protein, partial [Hyphomicrobiaceae bacterium]
MNALIESMAGEQIALASITASELLHGMWRADSAERRARREALIEAILATIPIVPFDLPVARIHAELWAQLTMTGRMIGAHDLIIAATALTHGYDILSENIREFGRVPGL